MNYNKRNIRLVYSKSASELYGSIVASTPNGNKVYNVCEPASQDSKCNWEDKVTVWEGPRSEIAFEGSASPGKLRAWNI